MNALIQTGREKANRAAVTAAAERTQYLTFMLGGEMFAIGILAIAVLRKSSSMAG